jgi:DNA-binding NtrC family response regulator
MIKPVRLPPEERDFLARLVRVIFANPFATEKTEIEALVGRGPKPAPGDHALVALAPILDGRLRKLEARGVSRIGNVAAEDRQLLQYGYLFQAYDRFIEPFDALIQTQIDAGDSPVDVPFAGELMALLKGRGFAADDVVRLMALFYQIRRAYYFIARSLVGDSPSMQRLRRALWDNVFTTDILAYREHLWNRMEDFSTLLLGETGTGKGTAAAAIGRSGLIPFDGKSRRFTCSFTSTFISVNLSQYPETLIESELFGHRKGAFTGAIDDHQGLFHRCSRHGSLFLDEIGDLVAPVQLKLLSVIQERIFSPVGGRKVLRFEGRVIAATNRSLEDLRQRGGFRDDFFYRLSSDVIEVPPLRQRLREQPRELDQLVGLLMSRITGRPSDDLATRVIERLRRSLPADYAWPGNVRELEQALRRILLKGAYAPEALPREDHDSWLGKMSRGELTAGEVLQGYCRMLHARYGTYEEVARRAALDRRTVKKHIAAPFGRRPGGRD